MSDLSQYVKNNSKYLSIQDGETVTFIYKGFSIIPDRFNPGKETVSYLFQDIETGRTIPWNKASNKVAIQFSKIGTGETVSITRTGEGMGTNYRIKVVEAKKTTPKATDDDVTPF